MSDHLEELRRRLGIEGSPAEEEGARRPVGTSGAPY
jgi:hypothetical protein